MAKVRICFRVQDAAVNEAGKPSPVGLCVDIGESDKEIDYNELTKDLDKREFITPEDYDEEYGSIEGEP